MKIVFVSGLLSPFQVELATELRRQGVDYEVIFTQFHSELRGRHWQIGGGLPYIHLPSQSSGPMAERVDSLLRRMRPDAVLCGSYRGEGFEATRRSARSIGVAFGLWLEMPLPHTFDVTARLRDAMIAGNIASADFVLAIGDRAQSSYRRFNPNVALVPYGPSLAELFRFERPPLDASQPIRFLYSGQLIPRQNIATIMSAILALYRRRGDSFRFVLAARGPAQVVVDFYLELEPGIGPLIEYDRDYATWSDRLRPFMNCDVFVYPSFHAGWGLVVPEAMAAGQCVIATSRVESARYLIHHTLNGLIIEPHAPALVDAMEFCLDNRVAVREMGDRARLDARDGDAEAVARRFYESVCRFTPGARTQRSGSIARAAKPTTGSHG